MNTAIFSFLLDLKEVFVKYGAWNVLSVVPIERTDKIKVTYGLFWGEIGYVSLVLYQTF